MTSENTSAGRRRRWSVVGAGEDAGRPDSSGTVSRNERDEFAAANAPRRAEP